MENLVFENNSMRVKVIASIGNNALLSRLNDSSFIVVNGLNVKYDLTCDWNFSYGYFEGYDKAYQCFVEKIVKPFIEYEVA